MLQPCNKDLHRASEGIDKNIIFIWFNNMIQS